MTFEDRERRFVQIYYTLAFTLLASIFTVLWFGDPQSLTNESASTTFLYALVYLHGFTCALYVGWRIAIYNYRQAKEDERLERVKQEIQQTILREQRKNRRVH